MDIPGRLFHCQAGFLGRAELEKDQGLKAMILMLAEYYRRLAKQRNPYQAERISP
jgi:hypothetical protein